MTRLSDVESAELARRLKGGLVLSAPPFNVRVQSSVPALAASLKQLYGRNRILEDEAADFSVRIDHTSFLRRYFRRQISASVDTPPPWTPLPEVMAPLMFEQAFNWCVATRTYTHLILHAAVVARGDKAIVIPGQSGQGKSTLCASLVASGWRHLSDEFALVDPETLKITAHPRPISLKNQSISVMQEFAADQTFSETLEGTPKGQVAYMQPSAQAVEAADKTAQPVAIVFPGFKPGESPRLEPVDKARAFILLTACSVNYREMGEGGFNAMGALVDGVSTYEAIYGDTAAGVALAESLLAS